MTSGALCVAVALTVLEGVVKAQIGARGVGVECRGVPARLLGHPLPLVVHHSTLTACALTAPASPLCASDVVPLPLLCLDNETSVQICFSKQTPQWLDPLRCSCLKSAFAYGGQAKADMRHHRNVTWQGTMIKVFCKLICIRSSAGAFREGLTRVSASGVDESVTRERGCIGKAHPSKACKTAPQQISFLCAGQVIQPQGGIRVSSKGLMRLSALPSHRLTITLVVSGHGHKGHALGKQTHLLCRATESLSSLPWHVAYTCIHVYAAPFACCDPPAEKGQTCNGLDINGPGDIGCIMASCQAT